MSSAIAGSAATMIATNIHPYVNISNAPSYTTIHSTSDVLRKSCSTMILSPLEHHDDTQLELMVSNIQLEKVTINISGTLFETLEATLYKYPQTLLGCVEKRKQYFNHDTKQYYFARDKNVFNAILYYYQSGGKLIRPHDVLEEIFLDDLRFFEIDPWNVAELEYGCENFTKPKKHDGAPSEMSLEQRGKWHRFLTFPSIFFVLMYLLIMCIWSEQINYGMVNNGTTSNYNLGEDNPMIIFRFMCAIWFLFEFIIRFITSSSKCLYLCSFIAFIDVVSVVSTTSQMVLHHIGWWWSSVVNFFEALSFLTILKLSRSSHGLRLFGQTLKDCSGQLLLSLYCVGICLLFHATLIYYIEYPDNEGFTSIADAFWYVTITLTTVGYGDVVPKTLLGKLVGAVCSVVGVTIVMAWSATIFVSYFTEIYSVEVIRKKEKKRLLSRTFKKFKKTLVHFDKRRCGFELNNDNNNETRPVQNIT